MTLQGLAVLLIVLGIVLALTVAHALGVVLLVVGLVLLVVSLFAGGVFRAPR